MPLQSHIHYHLWDSLQCNNSLSNKQYEDTGFSGPCPSAKILSPVYHPTRKTRFTGGRLSLKNGSFRPGCLSGLSRDAFIAAMTEEQCPAIWLVKHLCYLSFHFIPHNNSTFKMGTLEPRELNCPFS